METKNNYRAWFYLAPTIILMTVFTFYPLFRTFIISFLHDYNYMTGRFKGVGLSNYTRVFATTQFKDAMINTIIIVFVSVPISTLLALAIAVSLNSIKALQKIFQTIFFIPYVTNGIAIGMCFAVMFHERYGLINLIFGSSVNWIGGGSSHFHNMVVLIIYIVWNALPFKILILMSGLQNINKQYYDAAKVDATPKWRVLYKITVPLLSPMIAYVLITSFIGAWKEYNSVIAIFGVSAGPGGARGSMGTVVWFLYEFIPKNRIGLSAAAACILFLIIMLFTGINLYVSKKKVHY